MFFLADTLSATDFGFAAEAKPLGALLRRRENSEVIQAFPRNPHYGRILQRTRTFVRLAAGKVRSAAEAFSFELARIRRQAN